MSADPQVIQHIKGTRTPFRVRLLLDGSSLNLTGMTVRAGMQKQGSTAASSAAFKSFLVTLLQPLTGVLSGAIPSTAINWTGPTEMRLWNTGTPRTLLGPPLQVRVRALSSNWVP